MQLNHFIPSGASRRVFRAFVAGLALLATFVVPTLALAHPLGNFTINHYSRIELWPEKARVFYVLDMAEIPTFQTKQKIDVNGDGNLDAAELDAFKAAKMGELYRNLQLSVNGRPVELRTGSPELSFPPGQGGLSLMRLTFWMDAALPSNTSDAISAEYLDNNEPDRLGWREIVLRTGDGVNVLDSTVSSKDVSDELRSYPSDMLSSPLRQLSASFQFSMVGAPRSNVAQVQAQAPAVSAFGSARTDPQFANLITLPTLDPTVVLLALLAAVGLGALHAMEPGHGKTTAAAYLVGSRATPRHAILLGLTITATHTSSVFLLGIVTLFLSQFIVPERLLPWLGLASGLIVIAMGVRMFISRLGGASHPAGAHTHGAFGMHDHQDGLGHSPATMTAKKASGWRGVLTVGFAGGLVPCPAALIVLLSALGLGRLGFGIVLIVAFSAGLALVLCLVGLSVIYGRRWLNNRGASSRIAQLGPKGVAVLEKLPAFSGLLVIGAGALLLYHATPFLRILR